MHVLIASEGMAAATMGSALLPAMAILRRRAHIKVARVAAIANVAEMVDHEAYRDRTNAILVSNPMYIEAAA